MKRTQIQLDEETYRALRRRAFERGVSMSEVVRGILRDQLAPHRVAETPAKFTFINSGRSGETRFAPLSERHDEALAEDFMD